MLQSAARLSFVLLLAFITFSTLSPISLRPNSGHLLLERVLAFVALGVALSCAFPRRWGWTLAVALSIPVGLEMAQTLIPTRHGRLGDAEEKAIGAAAGVMLGAVLTWAVDGWRSLRSQGRA